MCHRLYRWLLVVQACILVSCSRGDPENSVKRRPARVDCLRYVFAPQCRGVSAKRGSIQITRLSDVIPEPEVVENAILKRLGFVLRNRDSARTWQPLESLPFPWIHDNLRPRDRKSQQANELYANQDNVMFP